MLEIIFLVWFVRKLSGMATAKGRSGGWGGLGALFWIGGEVTGFVIGAAAIGGLGGGYLIGLPLAILGAIIAYVIVSSLGPSELMLAASGAESVNPHYDPSNPYSPPRGGDGPPTAA